MPGTARHQDGEFDDDEESEEAHPEVIMAAVFQNNRLGVAWYDSAHGEVRHSLPYIYTTTQIC